MSETRAASPAADRPSRIPWPPLLLVGAIAAAYGLQRGHPLDWPGLDDIAAHVIGYGFGIAGLALAAWSVTTLVRARTTVRPDRGADVLVTTGPFRRWRNPIYLADILIMLGLAELTHDVWFAILAPVLGVLITWLAILPEERYLAARFGDSYLDYKARTRRWI